MVFGQITPKLSMFWTAAMLMKAMCYRGILESKFELRALELLM